MREAKESSRFYLLDDYVASAMHPIAASCFNPDALIYFRIYLIIVLTGGIE